MKQVLDRELIFIQSTHGDAHQFGRYNDIKGIYERSKLLGFERDYYEAVSHANNISLGFIQHGSYCNRVVTYLRALKTINGCVVDYRNTDIYFYSLDFLPFLIFFRLRRCRLILEMPDLRDVFFGDSVRSRVVRLAVRLMISFLNNIVFTSDRYVTYLKSKSIKHNLSIVIENKVRLSGINNHKNTRKGSLARGKIVIGYFGLLRCETSLRVLLNVLEASEGLELIVYGYFMNINEILQYKFTTNSKVSYRGTYISPDNLSAMYEQVDVSWICYPYSDSLEGNYRLARTNRYYEAGHFMKPMIAAKGTADADRVEELNCGVIVDYDDFEATLKSFSLICRENIEIWRANLFNLSKTYFKSSDCDYSELFYVLGQE